MFYFFAKKAIQLKKRDFSKKFFHRLLSQLSLEKCSSSIVKTLFVDLYNYTNKQITLHSINFQNSRKKNYHYELLLNKYSSCECYLDYRSEQTHTDKVKGILL